MKPILIVDDEAPIRALIRLTLERAGYTCDEAATGTEAADKIEANTYDLALLDIMLPGPDGYELLDYLRSVQTPVIFLTAKTAVADRVRGLHLGADDYITKPFGTSELLARIRTSLRHSNRLYTTDSLYIRPYRYEDLVLDFSKRELTLDKQPVHLTPIEYKIVSYLAQNSGKVMTYAAIISNVWGPYADDDNKILRVNMANIRRKLEKDPAQPKYIFTEVGVGYRMQEDSSEND